LWAGVSVSDMAAAVAVSRTAANYSFRPDCLCETSFARFARLGASTQAVRNVSHSFAMRKFRISHDTLVGVPSGAAN